MTEDHHLPERLFAGPIGKEYEKLKQICPAAAEISGRVAQHVAAWRPIDVLAPLSAIEIGCGTGITSASLLQAREDLTILALDNEPGMLEQARLNLSAWIEAGRIRLAEADALAGLREVPDDSVDLVASGYALHNFRDGYRTAVLSEIPRVLKPGGLFVNGDRYALDDTQAHTRQTQEEVKHYFQVFTEMGRADLLQHWIVHLFSDESPDHIMRLSPSLDAMRALGFVDVRVCFRDGVNALVTAAKPC